MFFFVLVGISTVVEEGAPLSLFLLAFIFNYLNTFTLLQGSLKY